MRPSTIEDLGDVRGLTIQQPYADLVAAGEVKPCENRSWSVSWRGWLFVHAGQGKDYIRPSDARPRAYGAVVAVSRLWQILERRTIALRSWTGPGVWRWLDRHPHCEGPYCWTMSETYRLVRPVACRGAQGIWTPDAIVVAAVLAQMPFAEQTLDLPAMFPQHFVRGAT
jgi:hypothetical protein